MNTEERLQDALAAVGDTIGPADVPALRLPPHRRFGPSRRGAMAAVAASSAAVAAGAFFAAGPADSGGREPVLGPAPAAPGDPHVAVFLCSRRSANPACERRDVTGAQLRAIETRLRALPEVRSIRFESEEESLKNFREHFTGAPEVVRSVRPGDVPASFRLVLHSPVQYAAVVSAVVGMPGVDQIIDEKGTASSPN